MAKRTVWLLSGLHRDRAKLLIDRAPAGFVATIGAPTRSDEQNRKLWPMIKDVQEQVPGTAEFSAMDMKNRFMHALGCELRMLPELEGPGEFPVGLSSSVLNRQQFAGLIELISAYGARHGVQWSDPILPERRQ